MLVSGHWEASGVLSSCYNICAQLQHLPAMDDSLTHIQHLGTRQRGTNMASGSSDPSSGFLLAHNGYGVISGLGATAPFLTPILPVLLGCAEDEMSWQGLACLTAHKRPCPVRPSKMEGLPAGLRGQQGPLGAERKLGRCEGPSHKGQVDRTPAPGPTAHSQKNIAWSLL